jgi:hypothetical protein
VNRISDKQWEWLTDEANTRIRWMFDQLGMEATMKLMADEAGRRGQKWGDQANQVMSAVDDARLEVFGGRR